MTKGRLVAVRTSGPSASLEVEVRGVCVAGVVQQPEHLAHLRLTDLDSRMLPGCKWA